MLLVEASDDTAADSGSCIAGFQRCFGSGYSKIIFIGMNKKTASNYLVDLYVCNDDISADTVVYDNVSEVTSMPPPSKWSAMG